MPWEHCGGVIDDNLRCPSCGIKKPTWTLRLDKTRVFTLAGTYGDPEAQAATLRAAADRGAPFCEECEE